MKASVPAPDGLCLLWHGERVVARGAVVGPYLVSRAWVLDDKRLGEWSCVQDGRLAKVEPMRLPHFHDAFLRSSRSLGASRGFAGFPTAVTEFLDLALALVPLKTRPKSRFVLEPTAPRS